jgi:hypothetical protein
MEGMNMSAQYFARIDENNKVIDMAVTTTEFMVENPERYPGTWVETFFDRADKRYAGVGFTYDPVTQDFTEPPVTPIPSEG